ncbi:hypothetical protein C5167_031356, partial [Papaver somniferum]
IIFTFIIRKPLISKILFFVFFFFLKAEVLNHHFSFRRRTYIDNKIKPIINHQKWSHLDDREITFRIIEKSRGLKNECWTPYRDAEWLLNILTEANLENKVIDMHYRFRAYGIWHYKMF